MVAGPSGFSTPTPTRAAQRFALIAAILVVGVVPRSAAGQPAIARPVTFAADIAPIVFEHCGSCHRPGGAGPFSLVTYAAARQRAGLMAQVTKTHLMPPWKSEPGYGDFVGHVHLTEAEIDRFAQWAAEGAPEGDPHALPPMPAWADGWQLGTPSVSVPFPEPYVVPAEGPDFSRTFVLRLPVTAATYVRGFEFRPGSGGVVHHANIRIDATRRSRELDEQDPGPGYSGLLLSSAVYPDGHFLGWTPGQVAPLLPKGLAWKLNPGTDLVIEIHFVPNGKSQEVQPAVALYFTDDPPERTPAMLRLGRQSLDISSGEKHFVSTDSFVLPVDVDVQAVQPHAHYRAREVKGTATLPDGTSMPLIYIKDWDYRWQHVYRYVAPPALPKGTRLDLQYVFDNSADNPRNPHQPPQPVHWGQRASDEMGDLWVQMLTRNERDLEVLKQVLQQKHVTEEIVGYQSMIRSEPSNVALRNDLAVIYTEIGQPGNAVPHLERVAELQPASAAAHYNLGTLLSSIGKTTAAIEQYREALRLKPDYAAAHNNLGHALLAIASTDEAQQHFRDAARLDPQNASAHYNLGLIARARGDLPDAVERLREAVRLQPDWTQAATQLAWVLATTRNPHLTDVEEAVRLAERAAAATNRRNATVLDVLAAAQAAAGQFDRAIRTCDEALALEPDGTSAAAVRQRRALYVQHRTFISR
jgi:tetratricopeptide (TPR) repeat protein